MSELDVYPSTLEGRADEPQAGGRTVSWLAKAAAAPRLLGQLTFGGTLKRSASDAVEAFHGVGVMAVMDIGDKGGNTAAADRVLGIDGVDVAVFPGHRAALSDEFERGGDGAIGSPALAAAHVGIATSTATDVGMHAAGVRLIRSDPALVAAAIDITRRACRKIDQNPFLAFRPQRGGHLARGTLGCSTRCSLARRFPSAASAS
ncbi:hypothetical protein [Azohydromonas sp.]|uniref:hypothetical protein n=1 Tax=Azohydromonas sp. TaxID=1872666 RepID=UPI002C1FF638|nr:hypothetical protein [Azohydromonas sp.]HMM85703.1 hypothetical protein [Azohydromonas sp.]